MVIEGMDFREIDDFIAKWTDGGTFLEFFSKVYILLKQMPETSLEFVGRPGVSYSLRPKHASQKKRNLFAMIDVIDDDPTDRWLSVCFYEDMITDPDHYGECIPGGLAGSDGYCFDLNTPDPDRFEYIVTRLREAWSSAKECRE